MAVAGAGQCPAAACPSRSRPTASLYSRAVRVSGLVVMWPGSKPRIKSLTEGRLSGFERVRCAGQVSHASSADFFCRVQLDPQDVGPSASACWSHHGEERSMRIVLSRAACDPVRSQGATACYHGRRPTSLGKSG